MTVLDKKEIIDFQEVHKDEIGNIYRYKGLIIRIIRKDARRYVQRLLDSGLIDELINKKMLVETSVSEYTDENDSLILEHKTIFPVSVVSQWSFSMFRDAALLVLEMNRTCMRYGYELKDCHPYNVLFDNTTPVYVDFGSIVKQRSKGKWIARKEFLSRYYYPLKLWKRGYVSTVSGLLKSWTSQNLREMRKLCYGKKGKFLNGVADRIQMDADLEMRELINILRKYCFTEKTRWGAYQNAYWEKSNKRFEYEIEWIGRHPEIQSIVEVGANQGNLSYAITEQTGIRKVIATDYDKQAVDIMYGRLKKMKNHNITPLLLDFVNDPFDMLEACRCDLVIANALTHHLILTQGLSLAALTSRLEALTNRYVIVEFMPLGTKISKTGTPKWYTLEWFLEGLSQCFEVIAHQKMEKNRIIIIGEKRK